MVWCGRRPSCRSRPKGSPYGIVRQEMTAAATDLETGGDNSELYDRRLCPNPAQGSHLKRPMIPQRRSQDLARCLFGTVAMPRRSPDRPEAGRAYQVDNAAGAIPNARVSLAMDVSGAPSGNRSSAANPAVVMLAALTCSWRHSSNASRWAE